MTEFVFKPSRKINGKRVRSRLFSGRYSLARGEKIVTVPLDTPDEQVARKKLRMLIVEQQREAIGLIAPRAMREALVTPLSELLVEYQSFLVSRGLTAGYIRDTIQRLKRMCQEAQWKHLSDIRVDSFLKWRGTLAA